MASALLTNSIARNLLISVGLYVAEKTTVYAFNCYKRSKNSTKSNEKSKCEEGVSGEDFCPICREKFENENENGQVPPNDDQSDDFDKGIFVLHHCKHKFHYKCLLKWRLIYKKCAVCGL